MCVCVCNEENLSHESEREQEDYGECIWGKKGKREMYNYYLKNIKIVLNDGIINR